MNLITWMTEIPIIKNGKYFGCICTGRFLVTVVLYEPWTLTSSNSTSATGIFWALRWFFGKTTSSANAPIFSEFCLRIFFCRAIYTILFIDFRQWFEIVSFLYPFHSRWRHSFVVCWYKVKSLKRDQRD